MSKNAFSLEREGTLAWPLKQEFWDGQRWMDLQWFWDPSKVWPLPTLCVHCSAVISVHGHLTTSPDGLNNLKTVTCPECFETFHHSIEMARGSPLNLALIAHTIMAATGFTFATHVKRGKLNKS